MRELFALNIKIIVDEAISGFGRTGSFWGFEKYRLNRLPDHITFGKASKVCGMMSLPNSVPRDFGNTVTNDFNCTAMLESYILLKYMADNNTLEKIKRIGRTSNLLGVGLLKSKQGRKFYKYDAKEEDIIYNMETNEW